MDVQGAEEGLAVKLGEREEVLVRKNQTEAENEAKMNEVVNERQLFQERLAFIETLQKQISGFGSLFGLHSRSFRVCDALAYTLY
jgi:hypothetical protein